MRQFKGISWLVMIGIAAVAVVLGGTVGTAQAQTFCNGSIPLGGVTNTCSTNDNCSDRVLCLATAARPELWGDCPDAGDPPTPTPDRIGVDPGYTGPTFLYGRGARDIICGGSNIDTISGGDGADAIAGGPGNDNISGDGGADRIFGNAGSDNISGGAGNDTIEAGAGDDVVAGGAGADDIDGGAGDDFLSGNGGDDDIDGGAGDDVLLGGLGDDVLDGGAGNDTNNGGPGFDECSNATPNPNCELVF